MACEMICFAFVYCGMGVLVMKKKGDQGRMMAYLFFMHVDCRELESCLR